MSVTDHTQSRVTFIEDGDANHWSMLTEDGKWLLAMLANGEQTSERQAANMRRLAACWNACRGISTEVLENVDMVGDTLAGRFKQRDQNEQDLHTPPCSP